MSEKLIIKNFGPIKHVELELKKFNVLIGESGTGKSTVAKVLASIYDFFRDTNPNQLEGLETIRLSEPEDPKYFKKHLSSYGIGNYLESDSFIELQSEFRFHLKNEKIKSNYREHFRINPTKLPGMTYIPADRTATSLFSNATWPDLIDIENGRIDLPKYFLRFSSLYNRLKRARKEYDFKEILGIKFQQKDGVDRIILGNGKSITINESASAIQANLSLCMIIDWQTGVEREEKNTLKFLIEEPELNFFPETQNRVVKYIVSAIRDENCNVLITTHSPYILTSLNNLMYAYKVGQNNKEEVGGIIEEKYWLNPDDVSAYQLLADGTCENIMDKEERLMKAEKIDVISGTLNEQFDALLSIEFAKA